MKDGKNWLCWFYLDISKHKVAKESDLISKGELDELKS